jgi:hypothetical protein
MFKWSDFCLEDVQAVNLRLAIAKTKNWRTEIVRWESAQQEEQQKYLVAMENIHRDWDFYEKGYKKQELYNACELAYLLSGGHDATLDTKEKRDAKLLKLVKEYYGAE